MHVCLVTGSSRGFGRLICEHLAANGHRVYASMRDTSGPGADLAETCELVELDVIDGDSVTLAVERIVDREGRLDVVVNNAGYVLWGPVEETPIEEVQREFDVNVFGALRVACAAAPVMRRRGSGGRGTDQLDQRQGGRRPILGTLRCIEIRARGIL